MADNSGLSPDVCKKIRLALANFPGIDRAVLYGSRAMGTYREGSDIDLTLFTNNKADSNLLYGVMRAVDDLGLIYSFDISLHNQIQNDDLKDHIARVGVEFYNADSFAQEQEKRQQQRQHAKEVYQSEAQLEEGLIQRLQGLGYERVEIRNSDELKANLKRQLEIHNEIQLSDSEFSKVLNHLDKGNVFDRAGTLRDRMELARDDGTTSYLQFLNSEHWCRNEYQVTNQVTLEGSYKNRYDVTLLVNGLPLVQIELKRRGMELKEAFNQINRYQRHSFWADSGLFQYVQLFVISNGVNTKYYANNRKQSFKQTFYWAKENNELITKLDEFADIFLEKCHVSKMICKYIVLHQSDKILMALRPYQYYAVEAIVDRVKNGRKNGYVWHTTGSGKTLTSYKAAQILTALPKVHKVVFVVDRADLDYQTTREFNFFSEGSVDGTNNTKALVRQMAGDSPLTVTTIQKLNTAIKAPRHEAAMEALRDKRVVFIFDECHRSQFGDTHKNIVGFFTAAQMFGFTGTPIFADNASSNEHGKRTTRDLFGECLHKYVITNAISDQNVLRFSIEYWGKLKRKDGSLIDEEVPAINVKEFFDNPDRIDGIVDWVIAHHDRKTHKRNFSAMFCVSSVDALCSYYEAFRRKKEAGEHNLRVVTIFTYGSNEDDADANGLIGDPDFDIKADNPQNKHSRDKLEEYIGDYNAMYKTKHSVKDGKAFYSYYKDIAKRMKEREREDFVDSNRADILLVVNMYLTGFDAKKLNTLYVDKNLRHHGLIQAYSRTNRVLGELKSQGNIICFRNLKKNTDEAIALFSDPGAKETILVEPYEQHVELFNQKVVTLQALAPTPEAVDLIINEDDQLAFVRAFRQLMRILNVLKSFTEFTFADLDLSPQEFEDYKSKYLDIYERTKAEKSEEAASIVDEVDFELELIQRDEINVAYILKLLAELREQSVEASGQNYEDKKKAILDLMDKEIHLRSKRELIEKFINQYMPTIDEDTTIQDAFTDFWDSEKHRAIEALCDEEGMVKAGVYEMIDTYLFSGKMPLRETVFDALKTKPKILERKAIFERISEKLLSIVHTFDDALGDV